MATSKTTQKASSENTTWIAGAKFNFQALRVTVDGTRVFLGAQGWCKKLEGNAWVGLELTAAGLQELVKAANGALTRIQGQ